MKINKNIWILIVIAVLIIANVADYKLGTHIYPLLFLVILIALVVYLIILAKRYMDAKASESEISTDLHAKIVLLNESMDRIEKKVEKIERILEKVSD